MACVCARGVCTRHVHEAQTSCAQKRRSSCACTCDSVIHSQTLSFRRRSPFLTLLLFFATPCARVCTHRASCTCFVHNASQRRVARRRGAEVVRDRCVQFAQRARNPRPCTRPRAPQPGAPCTRPGPCTNPVHATPCTALCTRDPTSRARNQPRARNPVHLTSAREHECAQVRKLSACVCC